MDGILAAHTLPTRPTRDAATVHLQAAIDAYRCGSTPTGDRSLADAWKLCLDDVRRTIAGRVREHDRRDDAEQDAFLKLWQAVRNWNPQHGPVQNAIAVARWCAHKAALNAVERRDRVAGREHGALDNEELRDRVEYRHAETTGGASLDDAAALADYARYAYERAGSDHRGKLWAAIILAVADGHSDRESIGQAVGIPAVSVRREIWHMVRTLQLDALDKLEVLVDYRTRETVDADTGQSALFNFEYQEIS